MMCQITTSQYLQMQCASPVSVIDITDVLVQLDQIETLVELQAPSMPGLSPPVEIITASFTEETDSISSLSTGVQEEESAENNKKGCLPNRSIFSKYWEKTGEEPVKPQSRMASLRRQRAVAGGMDQSRTYFSQPSEGSDFADCSMRTRCSQEQEQRSRRRSIFGHTAMPASLRSLPTLATEDEEVRPTFRRKARSASALQERPPSCLQRRARRRSSSVSFDEKIDVVIFQKPQEQFSEEGWEQLFHA
jgi:hypothetical protein